MPKSYCQHDKIERCKSEVTGPVSMHIHGLL